MRVLGFNFTKISSEKFTLIEKAPALNTNIEFTSVEKENIEFLKDAEALKIGFKCDWTYSNMEKKDLEKHGEIIFKGNIILALEKGESKEVLKSWKKKKLSPDIQVPLFNLILRKCTPKAAHLADEISLPSPIPLPKIKPQPQE